MKSFVILGLGRFGKTLALTLAQSGHQVLIIDEDSDAINALADSVTSAVVGDPTNEAVLRAAGVRDYDCAIVCSASNINDNILLTIMLKDLGVPKVVTRALNDGHKRVLERLGVDLIAFPEQDMGEKLAYMLGHDNVIESLDFDGYRIAEMRIPAGWVGKTLIELDLRRREKVNVIAVRVPGQPVNCAPSPTRPFGADDTVSVIGADEDIDRLTAKK